MLNIQHIPYQQINKKQWDACISSAGNGLIYGYSFYLDAMSKQWDGLVMGDYEAVMPITFNSKYGISYLYQPSFAASLGVFGNGLSADIINSFLQSIPKKFRYWDIYLNHGNFFTLKDFNLYERKNYVLPLNADYAEIYSRYRDNIKRNIKKCVQLNAVAKKNIPIEEVVTLSKKQTFSSYTETDFANFISLYKILSGKGEACNYGIYSSNGKLMASAAFFFSNKRAYYILVGNDPDGKTMGASHALIDAFIKDHAGNNLLLDFEGSDVPSLAFFYSSFGSVEEKYPGLRVNHLPFWARWMKK